MSSCALRPALAPDAEVAVAVGSAEVPPNQSSIPKGYENGVNRSEGVGGGGEAVSPCILKSERKPGDNATAKRSDPNSFFVPFRILGVNLQGSCNAPPFAFGGGGSGTNLRVKRAERVLCAEGGPPMGGGQWDLLQSEAAATMALRGVRSMSQPPVRPRDCKRGTLGTKFGPLYPRSYFPDFSN